MLLKRLEIAGFKSFAKPIVLEFPSATTAIVGPNGSGKSNVADAIRWVLGEQSMKSLRGKKGEDLIFAGAGEGSASSPRSARLGKASVALVFDNVSANRGMGTQKTFPYEFDEVIVSRAVYRDGANDYMLNGSPARLRDVIELLSNVGLGASQHHIIGQGDADRILYASPKERKEMIEDALGLKIFWLKKHEAERKLEKTAENIKDVESLRRELRPHLRYLEEQAKRSHNAAVLREELRQLACEYIVRERTAIARESREISDIADPAMHAAQELEGRVRESEQAFEEEDAAPMFLQRLAELDRERDALVQQQRALEQELWRVRERDVAHGAPARDTVPHKQVYEILDELRVDLEAAGRIGAVEGLRNAVFSLTQKVYRFLEELAHNHAGATKSNNKNKSLEHIEQDITVLRQKEETISRSRQELEEHYRARNAEQRTKRSAYRTYSEELARVRDTLREIGVRKEQVEMRTQALSSDFEEWIGLAASQEKNDGALFASLSERDQMRKKIERMRIRLEEAGGVDDAVLKEFTTTKERDEFLARELDDLQKAKKHVEEMATELEERIADDFARGLATINVLFAKFFQEIFGGGKAELRLLKEQKPADIPGSDEEDFNEEVGLDIVVHIPKKRIKSLAMLSGGERALTSIALLFAVSTVNPPPFLVLDETDAALDEANSSRYAVMLKELSKKTQLLVITHNRATMSIAPILYGVTMGSDGVSKLLSIKLEEAENVLAKE